MRSLLVLLLASLCGARRLMDISSCSEARSYCYNDRCSGMTVSSFSCDDYFLAISYSCQCKSSAASSLSSCFPGNAVITVQGRGPTAVKDLAAGDRILAVGPGGTLVYDQVGGLTAAASGVNMGRTEDLPSRTSGNLAVQLCNGAGLRMPSHPHVQSQLTAGLHVLLPPARRGRNISAHLH